MGPKRKHTMNAPLPESVRQALDKVLDEAKLVVDKALGE